MSIDAGFGGPSATRPQGAASRPDGDRRAASWCACRPWPMAPAHAAARERRGGRRRARGRGPPWAAALLLGDARDRHARPSRRVGAWLTPRTVHDEAAAALKRRARVVLSCLGSALRVVVAGLRAGRERRRRDSLACGRGRDAQGGAGARARRRRHDRDDGRRRARSSASGCSNELGGDAHRAGARRDRATARRGAAAAAAGADPAALHLQHAGRGPALGRRRRSARRRRCCAR